MHLVIPQFSYAFINYTTLGWESRFTHISLKFKIKFRIHLFDRKFNLMKFPSILSKNCINLF